MNEYQRYLIEAFADEYCEGRTLLLASRGDPGEHFAWRHVFRQPVRIVQDVPTFHPESEADCRRLHRDHGRLSLLIVHWGCLR